MTIRDRLRAQLGELLLQTLELAEALEQERALRKAAEAKRPTKGKQKEPT